MFAAALPDFAASPTAEASSPAVAVEQVESAATLNESENQTQSVAAEEAAAVAESLVEAVSLPVQGNFSNDTPAATVSVRETTVAPHSESVVPTPFPWFLKQPEFASASSSAGLEDAIPPVASTSDATAEVSTGTSEAVEPVAPIVEKAPPRSFIPASSGEPLLRAPEASESIAAVAPAAVWTPVLPAASEAAAVAASAVVATGADLVADDSPAPGPIIEPPRPQVNLSRRDTVPQIWFVLAVSYASAVTLVLAYLIYLTRTGGGGTHQLESLPDIKLPMSTNGKVQQRIYAQDAVMPKGHTLKLGESQRFGNLVVTPLRVTREPIEFVHYKDPAKKGEEPTTPVLKLWLKFENASKDQTFSPLGRDLVFARHRVKDGEKSNQFVATLADKMSGGPTVMIYPDVINDDWDLKGQNVDAELQPGQTLETYLPSDLDGLDHLKGELVWRVHLRKGLGSKTKNGVTTLVEVNFSSDQIEPPRI